MKETTRNILSAILLIGMVSLVVVLSKIYYKSPEKFEQWYPKVDSKDAPWNKN